MTIIRNGHQYLECILYTSPDCGFHVVFHSSLWCRNVLQKFPFPQFYLVLISNHSQRYHWVLQFLIKYHWALRSYYNIKTYIL